MNENSRYNAQKQNFINFARFYTAPEVEYQGSVFIRGEECEFGSVHKEGYFGPKDGIQSGDIHFFLRNQKRYALFQTVPQDLLAESLDKYNKYISGDPDQKPEVLIIPVIEKGKGLSEDHIVLVSVNYSEDGSIESKLFDSKGGVRKLFDSENLEAIQTDLRKLEEENQSSSFEVVYLDRQGAFDTTNCGPFVSSFVNDLANEWEIGTTAKKGVVRVKDLRKTDDSLIYTCKSCNANEGFTPLKEYNHLPEDFAPGNWNVENSTELFRKVKLALKKIELDLEVSLELRELVCKLMKETDNYLSKIKEKDAKILYEALSAAYGLIKPKPDPDYTAYQHILQKISEKIKDTPGLRIIGYILVGILAVALLAIAAIVIAALMTPGGLVLAAIFTTISSIFAQLTAFIAGVAASVSSFFATTFGVGAGASVVIAAADFTAGMVAASTGGVAGLLAATWVGFFAKSDWDENKSMKEVHSILEEINTKVAPQQLG